MLNALKLKTDVRKEYKIIDIFTGKYSLVNANNL